MFNIRDDEELCRLFKVESEEHIQRLNTGLLRLEEEPDDRANLRELFREAHTLKGSAGMVGASDMQVIAHRFEDLLGSASRGESLLDHATIGRLLHALDAIQKLVNEVVAGEPSNVDVWTVLGYLEGNAPDTASEPEAEPKAAVDIADDIAANIEPVPGIESGGGTSSMVTTPRQNRPANLSELLGGHQITSTSADQSGSEGADAVLRARLRIDTIRVEARRLDSLMTHAGELTVAAARLGLRTSEIEELGTLSEEMGRIASERHSALGAIQGAAAGSGDRARRGALERLNHLQSREEELLARLGEMLRRLSRGAADDSTKIDFLAYELAEGIRGIRLLPLSAVFNLFPRLVRDLAREQGKELQLTIEGGDTGVDKRILEEIKDPLMHMVRNAIDHGIEPPAERVRAGKSRSGLILLRAYQTTTNTVIEIADDGRGLDLDAIRRTALARGLVGESELAKMSDAHVHALIFTPGFSTRREVTDLSGRGVGMEVVRANIERLKGTIHIDTSAGSGCLIRIQLPLTLATARMLILGVAGETFAIPVESVRSTVMVAPDAIHPIEGRETILYEGRPISVAPLGELLELEPVQSIERTAAVPRGVGAASRDASPCVVVEDDEEAFGLIVDTLIDEQEVVLKPDSPILRRVRNVAGSTILGSGRVCVILNPHDLLRSMRRRKLTAPVLHEPEPPARRRLILLVEDSITTRTQVKRILESAGYEVVPAVDGVDGIGKLGSRNFDAVISDVQMPNMDGLSLTARIRQEQRYADLPVILITSLAQEEDRRRGIEVGASAYLTKPTFDQNVLLDTLRRLL